MFTHLVKAREKSCVHVAIDFGFASHWLKTWSGIFEPITKRSNCNHVSTFDGLRNGRFATFWPNYALFLFDPCITKKALFENFITVVSRLILPIKPRPLLNYCFLVFPRTVQ